MNDYFLQRARGSCSWPHFACKNHLSVLMRWKSVIYTGNYDWGAFNGHNFQSSVITSDRFDLLMPEIKWFCFRSLVGANIGDGVIIEGWLTQHIALRHRCRREGKWIDWSEESREAESAGWKEGNLKPQFTCVFLAAFHSKLADFLFLLWIMNFIKTVFCHKQEARCTTSCKNNQL